MKQVKKTKVRAWKSLAFACSLLIAAGCATSKMRPCSSKYTFIPKSEQYRIREGQVYPTVPTAEMKTVAARICRPEAARIKFHGNTRTVDLVKKPSYKLDFRRGVYPFQIKSGGSVELSGAMMFYNIDNALALATLGMTPDKYIFNEDLLQKARDGVLAKYTMQFEDRDVLTYWLGNRTNLYSGGDPTVEADFSGTPGITELRIGNRKVPAFREVLPVYTVTKNKYTGLPEYSPREYEIKLTCSGAKYKGRLSKLRDNEFTAFVRIPCTIPEELMRAAQDGTVARFSIMSEGVGVGDPEPVAEILISAE